MATHVQRGLLARLAGCAVLAAAPAAIALGTASTSHADSGDNSVVATPTHHEAFPGQNPQTDRPWYQTPRHDNKPGSDNPFDLFLLGDFGFGHRGPLGNLAKLAGLG